MRLPKLWSGLTQKGLKYKYFLSIYSSQNFLELYLVEAFLQIRQSFRRFFSPFHSHALPGAPPPIQSRRTMWGGGAPGALQHLLIERSAPPTKDTAWWSFYFTYWLPGSHLRPLAVQTTSFYRANRIRIKFEDWASDTELDQGIKMYRLNQNERIRFVHVHFPVGPDNS